MSEGDRRGSISVRPDRTFDFYHDRHREIAYDGIETSLRRSMHERLAVALESVPGAKAQVMLRHFRVAENLGKTIRYGLRAAEDAAHLLAFQRAARLFEGVLDDPLEGPPGIT